MRRNGRADTIPEKGRGMQRAGGTQAVLCRHDARAQDELVMLTGRKDERSPFLADIPAALSRRGRADA